MDVSTYLTRRFVGVVRERLVEARELMRSPVAGEPLPAQDAKRALAHLQAAEEALSEAAKDRATPYVETHFLLHVAGLVARAGEELRPSRGASPSPERAWHLVHLATETIDDLLRSTATAEGEGG